MNGNKSKLRLLKTCKTLEAILMGLSCMFASMSCQSPKVDTRDVVYAMVYDLDNNPVQDVSFYLDGKFAGKSDIYGRFLISDKNAEKIRAEKSGYEEVEEMLGGGSASVFYFKTGTVDQLLDKAEELFDSGRKSEALALIERAEKIDSSRKDILYFKEIINSRK